jgi:hypothetical protein
MINNGDGQHPALDTITRITPIRGHDVWSRNVRVATRYVRLKAGRFRLWQRRGGRTSEEEDLFEAVQRLVAAGVLVQADHCCTSDESAWPCGR